MLLAPTFLFVPVQDPLEFPAHELRKYFRMGDHVKVIAGRYEGDTGLIVRVEENFVILFSDLTMHEVNYNCRGTVRTCILWLMGCGGPLMKFELTVYFPGYS